MNKTITFFLGLLMGIFVCFLLFYFDVRMFSSTCPECIEKEIITHITTDTVYVEIPFLFKKTTVENKPTESTVIENIEEEEQENEVTVYDTEFFINQDKQDTVFSDHLLQTKIVKVKLFSYENQEVKQPDNFFQVFEIQQWSTPIKNKITYSRDNNMLRIKGMELDNVNIVFWNDVYYLEIANRYYAIPETKSFEKINLSQILP